MTKKKEREVDILEQKAIEEEVKEELEEMEKTSMVGKVKSFISKRLRKSKK